MPLYETLSIIWQLYGCFYYRELKASNDCLNFSLGILEIIITQVDENYEYWEIGAGKTEGLILSGPKNLQDIPLLEQEGANNVCAPGTKNHLAILVTTQLLTTQGPNRTSAFPYFHPNKVL